MSDLDRAINALKAADAAGNTEDAAQLAALVRQLSQQQPVEVAEEVETTGFEIPRQVTAGINERLADIYEAPVRLAEMVTKPLARAIAGTKPRPETESRDVVSGFLRDSPVPTTGAQRIARRTGEEIGATLPLAAVPFAGAAIRGAQLAATSAREGATVGQRAVNAFLDAIRATPGRAAMGELAATAGAGFGAGAAYEMAPNNVAAEVTGQLVGGLLPTALTTTPTAIATRAARGVVRRLSPEAQTRAAREAASEALGPSTIEAYKPELEQAERVSREIPGFEPSLAEATGSPSLVATQRAYERAASGPELEAMAARRAGSEEAIRRYVDEAAPQADAEPAYVIDTASKRITGDLSRLGAQQQRVAGQAEEAASVLPTIDRAETGAALRTRLTDIRRAKAGEMSRLADELGINEVDVTVPYGQWRDQIMEEFKPGSIFEDVRNYPDIMREVERAGITQPGSNVPVVRFADLKALRERVTDDLQDAIGAANPNRKKVRTLTMLKGRVDDLIDTLPEDVAPGLADNYRQFRETYFREYIEPFEQSAAFKVRKADGRGFYQTPDERVASVFFAPGDVSGIRQFKAAFGDDPEAGTLLANSILDSVRDSAVRDGRLDQKLFANWQRRHASVLEEVPEVRDILGKTDDIVTAIAAREAQLQGRQQRIQDSLLGRELRAMERGTRTPEQVIDNAIKDPRKMRQIVNSLRTNDEAMQSLRRSVWDMAVADGKTLNDLLENNRRSLVQVFEPGHLKSLETIRDASSMMTRVPPPQGQGISPDPLAAIQKQIGMGVPQIASRVFAAESGRTSMRFVAADALGRFMRGRSQAETEALLKQALYDPQVARDLATLSRIKRVNPAIANRLNARLFNLGFTSREEAMMEDEE